MRNTIALWLICRGNMHGDSYRFTRQPDVPKESRQKNAGALMARTVTQRMRCDRQERPGDGRTIRRDVDCHRVGANKRQRIVELGTQVKLGKQCSTGLDKQQFRGTAVFALFDRRVVARKRQSETEPLEVEMGGLAHNHLGHDRQRMGVPPIVSVVRTASTIGPIVVRRGVFVMVIEVGSPLVRMLYSWRRKAPNQHCG